MIEILYYPANIFKKYIFILILFLLFFNFISCTPSREYLLKKSKAVGIDMLNIRVLLKKTNSRISISSKSRIKLTDIKTGAIKYNGKGKKIYKAQDAITELMCALDMEKGGTIAANLYKLYEYMNWRLSEANIKKDGKITEKIPQDCLGCKGNRHTAYPEACNNC